MVPVTLLDPWALMQAGFWLSFVAVGLLLVSEPARVGDADLARRAKRAAGVRGLPRLAGPRRTQSAPTPSGSGRRSDVGAGVDAAARRGGWRRRWRGARPLAVGAGLRGGLRAQLIASLGLAPLTLVAFQQVSLVGLLANLVAEPWVTLVVTPLALLGIVVPGLWQLAALALRPLLGLLAAMSRWPLASVHVAAAPTWGLVAGLVGGLVLMLPIPWRVRLLGVAMLPPLVAPCVERPPVGRFELVAADVGQGTAVLVRTHQHLLVFDAGPRFGEDNDAGRRMLLPLLQSRGEPRIDTLMLSHADADHVGGAQSLIDHMPVLALRSSLDVRNPLRANAITHLACVAGQTWTWDGVQFRVLHPLPSDYRPGAKTNALSCVLRIVDAAGGSALLTGDVEAAQEAALVARAGVDRGDGLRSEILLVPHHGSRTSSTDALLDAVQPRVAVIPGRLPQSIWPPGAGRPRTLRGARHRGGAHGSLWRVVVGRRRRCLRARAATSILELAGAPEVHANTARAGVRDALPAPG